MSPNPQHNEAPRHLSPVSSHSSTSLYRASSIERRLRTDDAPLFPSYTERGPLTDVYLEETPQGFVPATPEHVDSREAHDHEMADEHARHALSSAATTLAGDHHAHATPAGGDKDVEKAPASNNEQYKIVTWLPDDKENPRNFSKAIKWNVTLNVILLCFTVALGSSIVTGGLEPQMVEFNVSEVVVNLSVSVFVVSFGLAPLLCGPLSEVVGRRNVYVGSMFVYFIFTFPCAIARNVETIIICRFFAGLGAAQPMVNGAASIADVWDVDVRGWMIAFYSSVIFAGPCVGPLIGGAVADTVGWRYMYWVLFAWSGIVGIIVTATMPETYAPVLLRRRAQKMRKESGDTSFVTEQELNKRKTSEVIYEMLVRPFQIMMEPIMICFSGYLSLIYTLLYAFFFAYPEVLIKRHGWSATECGLAFLSILIGIVLVAVTCVPFQEMYYHRRTKEAHARGEHTPPEARLPQMMLNAIILPISLFWFAFTSWPAVSPWAAIASGIPLGYSLVGIYMSANSYLVDAFPRYAASAMAAKTFIRSECGASVPLWLLYLYKGAGPVWGGSVFAFVSLAMCPIPFIFFFKGAAIRARSKRAS